MRRPQRQLLLMMPGLLHAKESRLQLLLPVPVLLPLMLELLLHGAGMYLRPHAARPLKPGALAPLEMLLVKPRLDDCRKLNQLGLMMPGLQYPNRSLLVLLLKSEEATGGLSK